MNYENLKAAGLFDLGTVEFVPRIKEFVINYNNQFTDINDRSKRIEQAEFDNFIKANHSVEQTSEKFVKVIKKYLAMNIEFKIPAWKNVPKEAKQMPNPIKVVDHIPRVVDDKTYDMGKNTLLLLTYNVRQGDRRALPMRIPIYRSDPEYRAVCVPDSGKYCENSLRLRIPLTTCVETKTMYRNTFNNDSNKKDRQNFDIDTLEIGELPVECNPGFGKEAFRVLVVIGVPDTRVNPVNNYLIVGNINHYIAPTPFVISIKNPKFNPCNFFERNAKSKHFGIMFINSCGIDEYMGAQLAITTELGSTKHIDYIPSNSVGIADKNAGAKFNASVVIKKSDGTYQSLEQKEFSKFDADDSHDRRSIMFMLYILCDYDGAYYIREHRI